MLRIPAEIGMNQKGSGSPMPRPRLIPLVVFLSLFWAAVPAIPAPVPMPSSSDATASKAAFLFNLSRFIEWQDPKDAVGGDSPVIFAVMEDDSLGPALKRMLESKGLNGQVLVIQDEAQVKAAREFFDVLSFDPKDPTATSRVVKDLKGSRVLTVSEAKDFLSKGGMVQVEMSGNAMQFKVNEKVLAAEGLKAAPAIRRMAGTTLIGPGQDPQRMYEAWKKVFDQAQALEGGLPVPSGALETVPILGRVGIAAHWIGLVVLLSGLVLGWRWFRGSRMRKQRHG